ncbi:MAG: hypothetical protein ABI972_05475 [Acidobacteriota bacterium]
MNIRTAWLMPLLLGSSVALAQESGLGGPVSGLVYDEQTHAIRIMMGVPGAAYLGASVAGELDFATVAPNGRSALALKAGKLALLRFDAELHTEPLAENYPTPSLSSWNSDSDAVAIYGAEAGIAVWRKIATGIEPAGLGNPTTLGRISAMSLEASTRSVVYVVDGDGADAVYRTTEGSEPALLANGSDIPAIAVSKSGVFFADRAANSVSVARDSGGSVEVAMIANESLGVSDPVGLAVLGNALLVASGANHELVRLNAATGELLGRVALDFTPDRLVALTMGTDGASPLFSLKSRGASSDPLEVLDAARGAVFFVPAADAVAVAVEE